MTRLLSTSTVYWIYRQELTDGLRNASGAKAGAAGACRTGKDKDVDRLYCFNKKAEDVCHPCCTRMAFGVAPSGGCNRCKGTRKMRRLRRKRPSVLFRTGNSDARPGLLTGAKRKEEQRHVHRLHGCLRLLLVLH